jgi:hypothetical protein
VRLIDVATRAVTTIAGSGTGTFADGTGSAASFKYGWTGQQPSSGLSDMPRLALGQIHF